MNGICISRVPRGTNAEILMRHEAIERVCAKVPQSWKPTPSHGGVLGASAHRETTEYLTVKQHQPLFQCLHLHSAVHTLQFVKFDAQVSQMVALKILVGLFCFFKK